MSHVMKLMCIPLNYRFRMCYIAYLSINQELLTSIQTNKYWFISIYFFS